MAAAAQRRRRGGRAPAGPLDYSRKLWIRLIIGFVLLFLYLPIVTLIVFSFNDSRRNIVWQGFTFDYYEKAARNAGLIEAFFNSMTIAVVATLISTILGGMVALGLYRFRFVGKPVFEGLSALPIVIPEICMGVSLMVFFSRIGWFDYAREAPWPINLTAITAAHIAFCFPFVTVVVRARLAGFDRSLAEAARDLGASEWQIVRDIMLPHMKVGLIAGALLAFTLSLDDFVITFFSAGPDTPTFPIKIFSMVRFSVTPEVNAASTVLIVMTIVITVIALRLQSPVRSGH
ncbi:MAG: ABC transporter permease subunit [Alphaproteobacteria bacterium]